MVAIRLPRETIKDWLSKRGLTYKDNVVVVFSFSDQVEIHSIHDGRDVYICNGVFFGRCDPWVHELAFFVVEDNSTFKLVVEQKAYVDEDGSDEHIYVSVWRDHLTPKEVDLLTEAFVR